MEDSQQWEKRLKESSQGSKMTTGRWWSQKPGEEHNLQKRVVIVFPRDQPSQRQKCVHWINFSLILLNLWPSWQNRVSGMVGVQVVETRLECIKGGEKMEGV